MTQGRVEKLCPYVLRGPREAREILAFRHPVAGLQIVKGTREAGEDILSGAQREFFEETGFTGVPISGPVWSSLAIRAGEIWHFQPLACPGLPERFDHLTADDGGRVFSFFWFLLTSGPVSADWALVFQRALKEIHRQTVAWP